MITLFASTSAEADPAANGGGSGFPAFDMWHWPSQIFWLVIIFTGLYLALSRFILPRIAATIERRGSTVAGDLDEAASLNDKSRESEQALKLELASARSNAHETANTAREKIDAEIAEETRKVDDQIDEQLTQAEARISATRSKAMSNVESIAADAAHAMMNRLGRPVSTEEARQAVKSTLN